MFIGTMREVTEAKEAEQRIAAEKEMLAELNRRRSAFYADISHELKTPLTVIAANAQYAAKQIRSGSVDGETIADLDAVSGKARRLARMVTGLVSLSRIQDGSDGYAPIAPGAVIGDTARTYKSLSDKQGNTLTVKADPALPEITGSADQLSQ